MNWNPIDTALKDGTPILTEKGMVKWACRYYAIIDPVYDWGFCDSRGLLFHDGERTFWCNSPKYWMRLPKSP